MWILSLIVGFFSMDPNINFELAAEKYDIPVELLEGICRYESDSGRIKYHKNKNDSWDVGLCQNHRKKSKKRPKIPTDIDSVYEAAKELALWKKSHGKFCTRLHENTGKCGYIRGGKFRGVKNCTSTHHWYSHYNHGYRVLSNNYGNKIYCFINNGFKKCSEKKWRKMKRNFFQNK